MVTLHTVGVALAACERYDFQRQTHGSAQLAFEVRALYSVTLDTTRTQPHVTRYADLAYDTPGAERRADRAEHTARNGKW